MRGIFAGEDGEYVWLNFWDFWGVLVWYAIFMVYSFFYSSILTTTTTTTISNQSTVQTEPGPLRSKSRGGVFFSCTMSQKGQWRRKGWQGGWVVVMMMDLFSELGFSCGVPFPEFVICTSPSAASSSVSSSSHLLSTNPTNPTKPRPTCSISPSHPHHHYHPHPSSNSQFPLPPPPRPVSPKPKRRAKKRRCILLNYLVAIVTCVGDGVG